MKKLTYARISAHKGLKGTVKGRQGAVVPLRSYVNKLAGEPPRSSECNFQLYLSSPLK